jgi:hypothetical protein
MRRDTMRYTLDVEMLERRTTLDDAKAIALLHSEFVLAVNAGCFVAVSADDIDVSVLTRSTPQEGVTRYAVALSFAERDADLDDEQALAILSRAFTNALNASFFLRVCTDDHLTVRLAARVPAHAAAASSAA